MPQPPPVRVGGRDIVKIYSLSKSNTLTKAYSTECAVDQGFRKKVNSTTWECASLRKQWHEFNQADFTKVNSVVMGLSNQTHQKSQNDDF